MFGEGSYSGKGIYDVAAFETTLANRVGDNRLLSHDLFEGIYARCGLASDVEVVEEYPSRYDVATARQHRWTRGDWQLLPWVLGAHHPLAPLGRWKMFDNLRRSLLVPAVLLGFALCWAVSAPLAWSLFFLGSHRSARRCCRSWSTCVPRAGEVAADGVADLIAADLLGGSGLDHGGCHPAHSVPTGHLAAQSPGMDHRGAIEDPSLVHRAGLLPAHVRRRPAGLGSDSVPAARGRGRSLDCRAASAGMAVRAHRGASRQPARAHGAPRDADRGR